MNLILGKMKYDLQKFQIASTTIASRQQFTDENSNNKSTDHSGID